MIEHRTLKKKTKIFLGLIRSYRANETPTIPQSTYNTHSYTLTFELFLKSYTALLNLVSIYNSLHYNIKLYNKVKNIFMYKILNYYSHFTTNKTTTYIKQDLFSTNVTHNIIIFLKPKKQLFLIFFKNKPQFIFTGGLMRKVMKETRKSSKKLYKVAVSMIKLSSILLINKSYFTNCYLKLKNIGQLRGKILSIFSKYHLYRNVNYIIVCPRLDVTAQKFNTRRSIKKYVKKRFKLNN